MKNIEDELSKIRKAMEGARKRLSDSEYKTFISTLLADLEGEIDSLDDDDAR